MIERCYVDRPGEWQEVSEEEFLQRTEWAGFWKKGTALQALKDTGQIRTPWAIFRLAAVEKTRAKEKLPGGQS